MEHAFNNSESNLRDVLRPICEARSVDLSGYEHAIYLLKELSGKDGSYVLEAKGVLEVSSDYIVPAIAVDCLDLAISGNQVDPGQGELKGLFDRIREDAKRELGAEEKLGFVGYSSNCGTLNGYLNLASRPDPNSGHHWGPAAGIVTVHVTLQSPHSVLMSDERQLRRKIAGQCSDDESVEDAAKRLYGRDIFSTKGPVVSH